MEVCKLIGVSVFRLHEEASSKHLETQLLRVERPSAAVGDLGNEETVEMPFPASLQKYCPLVQGDV